MDERRDRSPDEGRAPEGIGQSWGGPHAASERLERQLDAAAETPEPGCQGDAWPAECGLPIPPPSWIALPVGRAESGPSIASLVAAVRAAGGVVGGEALFDPRYEAEMRRFLIRALEMEGIPVPGGGDTP